MCIFIICQSILLILRNISDKIVDKIKTHILCSVTLFSKIVPFIRQFEKFCRVGEAAVDKWRMRIACSISKATNTHSGYVIIIAFLWQQWVHERVSMLRYIYTAPHLSALRTSTFALLKSGLQVLLS
jgi:hypothetical protein